MQIPLVTFFSSSSLLQHGGDLRSGVRLRHPVRQARPQGLLRAPEGGGVRAPDGAVLVRRYRDVPGVHRVQVSSKWRGLVILRFGPGPDRPDFPTNFKVATNSCFLLLYFTLATFSLATINVYHACIYSKQIVP